MKNFKNDFIAFATSTNSLTPVYTKNGMLDHFTFDYYIDYYEKNAVADLVSKQPDLSIEYINSIMDQISENLLDTDYYILDNLLSDFFNEYPQYNDLIDYHDIIETFEFYGNILPYEQLIYNSYVNVNILLNTFDDRNLEYANNHSAAIIEALHTENFSYYSDMIHDSSIKTLLNSQGIHEQVFYNYITNGSDKSSAFMDSLYNELLNGLSHEAVTFFTKMTVSDYLKLKAAESFTIPKNIDCGLVDFLSGSGSILEIELQSDITLQRDHVIIEKDGGFNYGIMDIYGLVGYNEVVIDIINEGNDQK